MARDGDQAHADLATLVLERAASLGAPAAIVGAAGSILRSTNTTPGVAALLVGARVSTAVRAAAWREPEVIEPVRGLRLALVPFSDGMGPPGRLAALAMDPSIVASPEFAGACRELGLDARVVRGEAAPWARFDASGAALLLSALVMGVNDLTQLRERDAALRGFTAQLTESYDTIELLYAVGRAMQPPFDTGKFLEFVCQRLHAGMNFRWVAAAFDSEPATAGGLRRRVVVAGEPPAPAPRLRAVLLDVLRDCDRLPMVLPFVEGLSQPNAEQVLVHGLTTKRRLGGVLAAGGKHGDDPVVSSYDIQLVEAMGAYINAFAENVALYEDQRGMFIGTLQSLTSAIDAKDRYTRGHSERVAHVARELSLAAHLPLEAADRIHIAGLVHDVGKIGVPEAVLLKPGRLTADEYAVIKTHPEVGYRILQGIPLLADVLPGVLHHHERYDGKGYPRGLAGHEIPLLARILAVADTFDAMSSNRAYRAALSREHVLSEIERSAGTQLDPELAGLMRGLDLAGYDALVAKHAQTDEPPRAAA